MFIKLFGFIKKFAWLIILVGIVLGIIWAYRWVVSNRPIPGTTLDLARQGVERNTDWQPVIWRIEGINMALVPAGCFKMGSTDEQLKEAQFWCDRFFGGFGCTEDFENERPSHPVCLENPYWIDVVEVSNRAYGGAAETDGNSPYPDYRAAQWPRESLTWREADEFCQGRGARLPSEAEWEYAARGPDNLIYPWGDTFDPADVNWHSGHPYAVGSKTEWVSWVGVQDLGGGVAEWVADWYGPYQAELQKDPIGSEGGTKRIARGGHWFSRVAYAWRTAWRDPYDPEYASSVVGFRCVRDFE